MANNVGESCKIWNCQIIDRQDETIVDENGNDETLTRSVVGKHGNCEHLRKLIDKITSQNVHDQCYMEPNTSQESCKLFELLT